MQVKNKVRNHLGLSKVLRPKFQRTYPIITRHQQRQVSFCLGFSSNVTLPNIPCVSCVINVGDAQNGPNLTCHILIMKIAYETRFLNQKLVFHHTINLFLNKLIRISKLNIIKNFLLLIRTCYIPTYQCLCDQGKLFTTCPDQSTCTAVGASHTESFQWGQSIRILVSQAQSVSHSAITSREVVIQYCIRANEFVE